MYYKLFVIFVIEVAIGCMHPAAFGESNDRLGSPPSSRVLSSLYFYLSAFDNPDAVNLDKLVQEHPTEIKQELIRIICLESHYDNADCITSSTLCGGAAVAAKFYGHEAECYLQLRILVCEARKIPGVSDSPNILLRHGAGIPAISGIVHGLAANTHNKAVDNLVDLIESGLLTTEYPFGGSRHEAYAALIARFAMETDIAVRKHLREILAYYLETEPEPRTKKGLEDDLQEHGLLSLVKAELHSGMDNPTRWKPPAKGLKADDLGKSKSADAVKDVARDGGSTGCEMLLAVLLGLGASGGVMLIGSYLMRKPRSQNASKKSF